jgi:tetratricopeptide (TPR) repeat protein
LGWVYYKKNQIDKAIEQLEKASLLLADAVIYDHLGDAYFKKAMPDKAAGSWEKSLELNPELGKVKEKLNRLEKENK